MYQCQIFKNILIWTVLTLRLYNLVLTSKPREEELHTLSLHISDSEKNLLLLQNVLLQLLHDLLHLLLQSPRGLDSEAGSVDSLPQLHHGEIPGAVLQPEARPQTVDGLNVEDLPVDLPLGLHQHVLLGLGVAALVGPELGLSSTLEDNEGQKTLGD